MFDKYYSSDDSYHSVDVQIQRAPTDQSVKLLAEFEQKARDKVIGAFDVRFNDLQTKWWIERTHNVFEDKATLRVLVDLNGKRHEFALATICVNVIRFKTPRVIVNEWKRELAEQISETLLQRAIVDDQQFNNELKQLFQYESHHNRRNGNPDLPYGDQ